MTVKTVVLTKSGTFRNFMALNQNYIFDYQNARDTTLMVLVTSKNPIQCVVAKF
jgi:hypothetical protein